MGIAVVDREVGYAESWQEEGKGLDVGRGGRVESWEEDGDLRRGSGVNEEGDGREIR